MKTILQNFLAAVLSLLLVMVLAETAASVHAYAKHHVLNRHSLIKRRKETLRSEDGHATVEDPKREFENSLQLHPLFGYTFTPNTPHANNYGFPSSYDFELTENGYRVKGQPNENALIIGIFGGSFAQEAALSAGGRLLAGLQEEFPGYDLKLVNFALPGHALPQTAFVYYYFRTMIDIVVFIDGYNELWNYVNNNRAGYPPEYAKAAHYQYKLSLNELTPDRFARTARVLSLKKRQMNLTRLSLRPIVRQSAVAHYVWTRLHSRWEFEIATESRAIERGFEKQTKFLEVNDETMLRIAANQWGSYHNTVHQLASDLGELDIHVIQPNLYIPNGKPFLTKDEQRILESDMGSSRGHCMEIGYPLLLNELGDLERRNVSVLDLTDVFFHHRDTIWIDVCHTNTVGYELVMDKIVRIIRSTRGAWLPVRVRARISSHSWRTDLPQIWSPREGETGAVAQATSRISPSRRG